MANTNFINECKNRANANRLGKIKIEEETTSTGNILSLSECLEKKINKLSLYGRCEQETSSEPVMPSPDNPSEIKSIKGKNLFGNITWQTQTYAYFQLPTLDEDYTLSLKLKEGEQIPTELYVMFTEKGIYDPSQKRIDMVQKGVLRFTHKNNTLGNVKFNYISVYPAMYKNSLTDYFDVQLEKGIVAIDYLPYNTIQVKDVGKNLFDSENWYETFHNINPNNMLKATINGVEYYKFRPNTIWNIPYMKGQFKENTQYIFSAKARQFDNIENYSTGIVFVYTDGTTTNLLINKTLEEYKYYLTSAPNKTINYIRLGYDVNNYVLMREIQLQVWEGTIDTEYEPYQENKLKINLQDNELCSLPNDVKDELVIENGRAKIIKRIGKKILNGTERWGQNVNQTKDNTSYYYTYALDNLAKKTSQFGTLRSNFFINQETYNTDKEGISMSAAIPYLRLRINTSTVSTPEELLIWLSTHNTIVYYELATPVEIDLGAVEQPKTFEGVNNISNSENTDMSVIYSNWNKMITNSDNLQNFEIDSGCYINGNIIGSVYAKCLKVSLVADTSKLADKNIQAQIGVKYANLSNEYINMGKYTTEHQNSEITANMSQITAYSDLYTKLDDKYASNIDYKATNEDGTLITRTVSDLYTDVCNQLGLIPVKTIFTNSDIPISDNPFTNGEKNRIVLQTISKIACAFVDIDADTNKIDLCWLSNSEEPDYTFYKNDYSNVDGGQVICGPINCLIIKNSQVDDENVTIKDDDDIALNGEHSIIISEDYILYDAELRQQAITSIWNKVKGMKYVDCKLTTYYGKPFLKLGDKIRVYTSATEYFDTYVLKHNFKYDGSFTSVIESPALTEREIKTKQNITLSEALKNTEISINKQNQKIELISKKSDDTSEQMSNLTQTVNGFDMTIKDVQKELNSASGKVQTLEGTITDMNFNFSTKGLSIGTSSDSNNSLLDNTGIRVYNYNKLNAIFNNKGSGIDKLIVTGTAQIGHLKFVKSVKNNKKVTKIYHLKELIEDLEDLEV